MLCSYQSEPEHWNIVDTNDKDIHIHKPVSNLVSNIVDDSHEKTWDIGTLADLCDDIVVNENRLKNIKEKSSVGLLSHTAEKKPFKVIRKKTIFSSDKHCNPHRKTKLISSEIPPNKKIIKLTKLNKCLTRSNIRTSERENLIIYNKNKYTTITMESIYYDMTGISLSTNKKKRVMINIFDTNSRAVNYLRNVLKECGTPENSFFFMLTNHNFINKCADIYVKLCSNTLDAQNKSDIEDSREIIEKCSQIVDQSERIISAAEINFVKHFRNVVGELLLGISKSNYAKLSLNQERYTIMIKIEKIDRNYLNFFPSKLLNSKLCGSEPKCNINNKNIISLINFLSKINY
jgi:hypothetical protein